MDSCLLDGFVRSNTAIKEEHGTGYKPPKLHIKPPASRMMEFMSSSVLLMLLKKQ
jgi:hypothetical protein